MVNERAVVNLDRCIGCGVCTAQCECSASRLQKKAKRRKPPKTPDIMYAKIMIERFGLMPTLKTVSQILMGKKA